nr:hypothetical protein [Hyphomonas sp. Mor2]
MKIRHTLAIGVLSVAAACSPPAVEEPAEPLEISPRDFVLIPCGPDRADRPCALVAAGGKRILFGAPAGVAASLSAADLRQLDGVIVFSLRAADIEGLDEIRNESWRAGRDAALLTIGPRGVLDVVEGLNKAFEQADALRIVEEGIPAGGYDAAILTGRTASTGQIVFDTGDVRVTALRGGYRISYEDRAVIELQTCERLLEPSPETPVEQVRMVVSCEATDSDLTWPLSTAHFVQNTGAE